MSYDSIQRHLAIEKLVTRAGPEGQDKKKYRQAALKAWKTIKKRKRWKAARNTKRITQFIDPQTIQKIRYPEMTDFL